MLHRGNPVLVRNPSEVGLLTQQNHDTGQYGYQGAGAEPGREDVGLHVAGEDGVFAVTGTHPDGQGVGAAQSREAIVAYLNGEVINVLG